MNMRNIVVALVFSILATQAGAKQTTAPSSAEPMQRHLTELLAYFSEPRLMENIVVVGWLCDGWGNSVSEIDNNAWVGFRPGLFLNQQDCTDDGADGVSLNYSNGIELKIELTDAERMRGFVGQLVTLKGDYFSWHNVISMESSFKSGVMHVKDMAAGNQRFQGAFGPVKEKD